MPAVGSGLSSSLAVGKVGLVAMPAAGSEGQDGAADCAEEQPRCVEVAPLEVLECDASGHAGALVVLAGMAEVDVRRGSGATSASASVTSVVAG